jgi:hypothetical protein
MDLTTEQKAALKTYIQANTDTNQLYVDGNTSGLADLLNTDFAPAFTVWRTSVTQDEVMLNGFDWARVDNLSIGKARIWEWMFDNAAKAINPSKPNIQAGIDAAWVGSAADLAVRAAVYVHCKRLASRVEKVFTTGTGSNALPATMAVEGPISASDVQAL